MGYDLTTKEEAFQRSPAKLPLFHLCNLCFAVSETEGTPAFIIQAYGCTPFVVAFCCDFNSIIGKRHKNPGVWNPPWPSYNDYWATAAPGRYELIIFR